MEKSNGSLGTTCVSPLSQKGQPLPWHGDFLPVPSPSVSTHLFQTQAPGNFTSPQRGLGPLQSLITQTLARYSGAHLKCQYSGRLRQEEHKFELNPGNLARLSKGVDL